MRSLLWIVGALGLTAAACPPPSPVDGGVPSSPHVTISVDEANVIGKSVSARIRVSSCRNVNQVQLLQNGQFLADVPFSANPATIEILPEHLRTSWSQGIAAELKLKAKVICDDTRFGESPTVNATFFPIDRRVASPSGGAAAPDLFNTQGGLGGTPVTFVGCIKRGVTGTSPALAISGTDGQHVMSNEGLPFACDGATQISERSAATGTRWVLQPGSGAYSIDQSLAVIKVVTGNLRRMAVASNGIAVFWKKSTTEHRVVKADALPSSSDWEATFDTSQMNGDPVIDVQNGAVWVPSWLYEAANSGGAVGSFQVYKLSLANGALLNPVAAGGGPPVVFQQTYSDIINPAIVPNVLLSADGTILYAPLLSISAENTLQTTILACSTLTEGCQGTSRKWATTQPFDRQLTHVIPFSHGNLLAAVGPRGAWFLKAQDGSVVSAGGNPITPSLGLQVLGVQAGLGNDVYLLNGPVLGEDVAVYPTEVVGVDSPEQGELYRFGFGDGGSAETSLTIGLDEAGNAWYRVGADLVKPYALSWYRQIKSQ
jgi:hypothetical protein